MAFLYSLCSSSKGNATYVGDKKSGVLIDAGIGIRELTRQMEVGGMSLDSIKAIFITHEHTDHMKGLGAILRKHNVPVYGSEATLEMLISKKCFSTESDLNEIDTKKICIGDIEVKAFKTPHDSVCSQCYTINIHKKKISICTDLGAVTPSVYKNIRGSDLILLESNYDDDMLHNGDYPYFLQERIEGAFGHLSNNDCSLAISRLLDDGTNHFLLGHLSENNNHPRLALKSALLEMEEMGAVLDTDYTLSIAPVKFTGKIIEL